MPLQKTIIASAESRIGVWKIKESLDELISMTHNVYADKLEVFSNESRKIQWLASRLILQELLGKDPVRVEHNEHGKPFLPGTDLHLSISHTNKFVAVIICNKKKVGIDIERIHPRIHKTRKRFVSSEEENWLKNSNFVDEQLFLIWGAKEAMLKIVGDRRIDFQKNMKVMAFEFSKQGVFQTRMNYLEIDENYKVEYEQIEDHLLVYIVD